MSVGIPTLCSFTLLAADALVPVALIKSGQPVDWWFVFKFNAGSFPECGGFQRTCMFGGTVQPYTTFGQQFAFGSTAGGTLRQGGGRAGNATTDPLGATFDQVYNGKFCYVLIATTGTWQGNLIMQRSACPLGGAPTFLLVTWPSRLGSRDPPATIERPRRSAEVFERSAPLAFALRHFLAT